MPALENRLVLYRFVCREFGYDDLGEMLTKLRDVTAAPHSSDKSNYASALSLYQPVRAKITRDRLAEYDANIEAHSRKLRMTGEHGRTWKPHQYLALLFTEHYLRRRFDGVLAITGTDAERRKCLILWRNLDEMDYAALEAWFARNRERFAAPLDVIYVNGDHTLNAIRQPGETWIAESIEPVFRELMFEEGE